MNTGNNSHSLTLLHTVSGTALALAGNIGSSGIFQTVVLAVVGAVVSFSTSLFLKWLKKKFS